MMEEESKTLDVEGPFKVSGDYFKEDNLYIDEIDLNELKVNGFTVDEMSKCFKGWLLFNQEKFLKKYLVIGRVLVLITIFVDFT